MIASSTTRFGLLATLVKTVTALDIRQPSSVTADEEFEIEFRNDKGTTDSFDDMFEKFHVFIATTPPGWGTGPSCTLGTADIEATSMKAKIPSFMAPAGTSLEISIQVFNDDPNLTQGGYSYGEPFEVDGLDGDWSKTELGGTNIIGGEVVPCSAYQCARDCSDRDYPAWTEDMGKYEVAWECVRECDGVDLPSFQELKDGFRGGATDGDADDDDEASPSEADDDDEASPSEADDSTESADEEPSSSDKSESEAEGSGSSLVISLSLALVGVVIASHS